MKNTETSFFLRSSAKKTFTNKFSKSDKHAVLLKSWIQNHIEKNMPFCRFDFNTEMDNAIFTELSNNRKLEFFLEKTNGLKALRSD